MAYPNLYPAPGFPRSLERGFTSQATIIWARGDRQVRLGQNPDVCIDTLEPGGLEGGLGTLGQGTLKIPGGYFHTKLPVTVAKL